MKNIKLKNYLINLHAGATGNNPNHLVIPDGTTEITRQMVPNRSITSVTIPNSVTRIGHSVFFETELTNVVIPNSVTSIGQYAFSRTRLTTVIIPNSVTSIENNAFFGTPLTSVTIPNSVTNIGSYAFGATQLTNVTIPDSITTIGEGAFAGLQLINVTIPDSVTNLAANAFGSNVTIIRGNSNALADNPNHLVIPEGTTEITNGMVPMSTTSVTIPDSVTSIGRYAFANTRLTSVVIPNSVTSIGVSAFQSTPITSVTIPNSVTRILDNVFSSSSITSIVIPNSVTSIGSGAFYGTRLTSVTIPNSVTHIGYRAFFYTPLRSVVIPNSVTNIDQGAFASTELRNVTIPNSVTNLAANAFNSDVTIVRGVSGATVNNPNHLVIPEGTIEITNGMVPRSTTSVTIPNSVTSIGDSAFFETELTNVVIPNSVTSIGESAFSRTELTNVVIPNSVTSIGNSAFFETELTSVVIPNSVTSIGEYAFGSTLLTNVTIPDSLTTIDQGIFYNTRLRSVVIPNSVTSIRTCAFFRTELTNVVIPNSVRNLHAEAFDSNVTIVRGVSGTTVNNPNHLVIPEGTTEITRQMVPRSTTSVTIPNSVTSIADSAFFETELTNVVIPNSVTSIGEFAFSRIHLPTVIIPNSVTSIRVGAFSGSHLTNVTIPDSLTIIDNGVFYNNPLRSVVIPNSVRSIGSFAFSRTEITNVVIPNSVTHIAANAFNRNVTITRGVSSATSNATSDNSQSDSHLIIPEGTTEIVPNSVTNHEADATSDVGESKLESKNVQIEKTNNYPIVQFLESIPSANENAAYFNVSRGNVFDSLKNYDNSIFYKDKWRITFEGESGIDQGGLRRDFFTELTKELVEKKYFSKDDKGFYRLSNKISGEPNKVKDYEFIGKLFAYVVKSNKSEFPNSINLKLHPYLLNELIYTNYGERVYDLSSTRGYNIFQLLDPNDNRYLDKIRYIHNFISKELKYSDRKVSNTNDPVELLEMIEKYNNKLLSELPLITYIKLKSKTEDEWNSLEAATRSICLEQNGFICDGYDEEHLRIGFPYDQKDLFIDFMIRINFHYMIIDEFEAFVRGFHSILHPNQMIMLNLISLHTLIMGHNKLDTEEFLENLEIIGANSERETFIRNLIMSLAREDPTYLNELLYLITGKKTLSVNKYKEFGKKLSIIFNNQTINTIEPHTCDGFVKVYFSNKLLVDGADGTSNKILTEVFNKDKLMKISGGKFCLAGGALKTIKLNDYKA